MSEGDDWTERIVAPFDSGRGWTTIGLGPGDSDRDTVGGKRDVSNAQFCIAELADAE
jgi:hypothetical protein